MQFDDSNLEPNGRFFNSKDLIISFASSNSFRNFAHKANAVSLTYCEGINKLFLHSSNDFSLTLVKSIIEIASFCFSGLILESS